MKREKEEEQRNRETEEKEEQKEQRQVEKEEKRLAQELSKIEREQKLAQAKAQSRKYLREDQNLQPNVKPTAQDSTGLGISVSKAKSESKGIHLPANKSYAAFISHKKTHPKHGDSSSTLARSLKVRNGEVCV